MALSPQKHLCCLAPWIRAAPGMAVCPQGGYLSPVLDLCMTQQLPSLCCARSPHLPMPTSIRARPAEEQCMALPETGAPGTAPGPDPCTPAGRSPVVRAGSARGTLLGCSCKHSPASATIQGLPSLGSPLQPPACPPMFCFTQTSCSLESWSGAPRQERTAGPRVLQQQWDMPGAATETLITSLPPASLLESTCTAQQLHPWVKSARRSIHRPPFATLAAGDADTHIPGTWNPAKALCQEISPCS